MADRVTDPEMLKYLKLATQIADLQMQGRGDECTTLLSKLTRDEMQAVLIVLATAAANPNTVYKLEMLVAHKSQQLVGVQS